MEPIMSFGTVQAEKMTTESGYSLGAGNASSFKNRFINGAMTIDQRSAGASVTVSTDFTYGVDRFCGSRGGSTSNFTMQQSTTVPTGFKNSLLLTMGTGVPVSTLNYAIVAQAIEGQNLTDFNLGTANSIAFTVSFWVRSSVTGTFGVSFRNASATASYCATYTINSANTFEYKTVAIPAGAINSGTWLTTNGIGVYVIWDLGVGSTYSGTANQLNTGSNYFGVTGTTKLSETTGATFYMTGVQLEVGTVATSFDFRSIGTELQLCQRYFETSYPLGTALGTITGNGIRTASAAAAFVGGTSTRAMMFNATFAVQKRVLPNTIVFYDPSASNASGKISTYSGNVQYTVSSSSSTGATNLGCFITTTTGTQTEMYQFHFTADSEL
jgi:hypothetical protein